LIENEQPYRALAPPRLSDGEWIFDDDWRDATARGREAIGLPPKR
jgi:predicted N-acyltransferase